MYWVPGIFRQIPSDRKIKNQCLRPQEITIKLFMALYRHLVMFLSDILVYNYNYVTEN